MGYLDNSSVTVDAILTNKGRQLLATGGQLNITKFALSDDEIDYDLWNPAHTLGTNYYGAVIENMPIIEALPDETQMLRYKLVTLPKQVTGIPVIEVSPSSLTFTSMTGQQIIKPTVSNMMGANDTLGYTLILSDDSVVDVVIEEFATVDDPTLVNSSNITSFVDDSALGITTSGNTKTLVGKSFKIQAKSQGSNTSTIVRALITIVGNETGGFKTITVSVDPTKFNFPPVA